MRKLLLTLATLFITVGMWAQTCGPGTGASICSYGPVTGTTTVPISMPSNGGLVPGFDYECSSGSCTVTLQACVGGQCVTLDSYSGGSTVRTPDQFTVKVPSAAFQYFIVTPTFASGTFTVLEVNNNTASKGGSSGSGGSGNANYTGTQNVVPKGSATAHTLVDGSLTDDGTNPVLSPNGLDTVNKGLSNELQPANDNPGTVALFTVCIDSSKLAVKCPTSVKGGVAGIAGVGAGNSGNVHVCTTQCTVTMDGATTVADWAIPSTTVPGELHDTGTSSLNAAAPTLTQSFVIDTVASGAGQTAVVDVFTPYQSSGGTSGSPPGNVFGPSSAVDSHISCFNGVTGRLIKDCGVPVANSLISNIGLPAMNVVTTFPSVATAQTWANIFPANGTFPANFASSGATAAAYAVCETNPSGNLTFTLTDVTTSTVIGTGIISSVGGTTFATTGGTTQAVSANDLYTVVSGTDGSALVCVIDFRATRS